MGTTLHDLAPNPGATKKRKRIGRGHGSGRGETAGKGVKGQKARTGHHGIPKPGFEGGQTMMARRLPKRGFTNARFKKDIFAVNIGDVAERFPQGGDVTIDALKEHGLVPRSAKLIKILSGGDIAVALRVKAHYFSAAARDKISAAKGSADAIRVKMQEGAE